MYFLWFKGREVLNHFKDSFSILLPAWLVWWLLCFPSRCGGVTNWDPWTPGGAWLQEVINPLWIVMVVHLILKD